MSQLPMSANLKNNQGDQQSRNERHTFVLVHGGWCGGWIFYMKSSRTPGCFKLGW
jgi:hypothetical protein